MPWYVAREMLHACVLSRKAKPLRLHWVFGNAAVRVPDAHAPCASVLAVLYSRLRFIHMLVLLRLLRLCVLRNSYPTICYACVTVLLACPSLFVATANSSATNAPMSEASALVHTSALAHLAVWANCDCRVKHLIGSGMATTRVVLLGRL